MFFVLHFQISPYLRIRRVTTEVYFQNQKIRFNGKLVPIMIKAAEPLITLLKTPSKYILVPIKSYFVEAAATEECWFSSGCSFASGQDFSLPLLCVCGGVYCD